MGGTTTVIHCDKLLNQSREEVSAPGSYYWEDGKWVEIKAVIKRESTISLRLGKRHVSPSPWRNRIIGQNIPGVKRIRFFMTFEQSLHLTHMKCLENVGTQLRYGCY